MATKKKASKRKLKLRIKYSEDKQFYYIIVGTNGQPLNTSETFKRHIGCLKTCNMFVERAPEVFEIEDTTKKK